MSEAMSAADPRGAETGYAAYHAPRYSFLLDLLRKHGLGPGSTLLDIGRARSTSLIHEQFGISVDSLGFDEDRSTPEGRHFAFDLNNAQDPDRWRDDMPRYDFVVMAEVLEHLYTAPQLTLGFVKTLLADGGHLILQTPNAASLPKRLKLLLGRHPYEAIRLDSTDPGHYREYTQAELLDLAAETGFDVEETIVRAYFDARFADHGAEGQAHAPLLRGRLKNAINKSLPGPLREGITTVWQPRSS